jgi:hypothetical protein
MATTQIELPAGVFAGQFTANIVERGPSPVAPTRVIRNDQQWAIECEWTLDGLLAPALDGTWSLQAVVEGLGTAVEITRAPVAVPLSAAPPFPLPRQYAQDIVFNPGDVSLGGQPSVLARVGVALTYQFPVGVGGQPGPIATFLELGAVQIYDGTP